MAKLDLALVVRTVDQATKPLRQIQRTVQQFTRRTGLDRVARGTARVGRRMWSAARGAGRFAAKMGAVSTAMGFLIGAPGVRAAGTIEQIQTAFESMLGSGEAASRMVENLTEFAARTPFQLEGISAAAKQLLGFGVDADKIIPTLGMLGDIAAGAAVPLADVGQIYGKALAKGKAQTEELNQMSERGIPILQALVDLAAKYGNEMSKEDVYKAAERGQISFKAIDEALRLMTDEGGIFNAQMEKQSGTLFGLASTVKDNVFLAFSELGKKIISTFEIKQKMRDFIGWLGNLTEELKKPKEEQEGFARAISETIDWLKPAYETLSNLFAELTKPESMQKVRDFFEDINTIIEATVGVIQTVGGWLEDEPSAPARGSPAERARQMRNRMASEEDDSDAAGDRKIPTLGPSSARTRRLIQQATRTPSLFDTPVATPEPAGGSPAARANRARGGVTGSRVTVDFRNLPRGARVSTEAPADADLEVTSGYAMMTAG